MDDNSIRLARGSPAGSIPLMSKKANPTSIGLFIVIGLALGVAGLIIFSSGKLFSKQEKFILYFDASLKGLNAGAPVKLRGVTVGSVFEVLITHNQATNDHSMPVIIEIDQKMAQAKSDRQVNLSSKTALAEMIRQGLRGKLDAASLVTGVLYVELAPVPNAPPPVYHQLKPEYPEIPTVRTEIQEILSNLGRVDIRGISDKLNALLARLDTTLGDLNMTQINAGVTNLLTSVDRVIGSPDLTNSLSELKQVLADARALVKRVDNRVDPLADSATNTLAQAQKTLADLRKGIQDLSGMVEPNAPFRADLTMAFDQLGNAARAIADLAEFLQRNPNALLTGRKPPQPHP